MRAALSAAAQWLRDAWSLPWRLKGPVLGVVIALLAVVAVVAAVGDSGDPEKDAARLIALSPTPHPTVVTTVETTRIPPPSPTVETTVEVREVVPSPTVIVEEVEAAPSPVQQPQLAAGASSYTGPYTFSGQGDKNTTDFCISKSQFTIAWMTSSGSPEYAIFDGFIYPSGETASLAGSFNYDGVGSDSTVIRGGPGCFYVSVLAANLSSWTVTVSQ